MLTKWWNWELMLATDFGSLCPKVTNFGSQNFGYQIWFYTRLIITRPVFMKCLTSGRNWIVRQIFFQMLYRNIKGISQYCLTIVRYVSWTLLLDRSHRTSIVFDIYLQINIKFFQHFDHDWSSFHLSPEQHTWWYMWYYGETEVINHDIHKMKKLLTTGWLNDEDDTDLVHNSEYKIIEAVPILSISWLWMTWQW